MLFGTFHLPRHDPTIDGLDDRPAPALWAQLIDPLLPAAPSKAGKGKQA